MRCTINDLKGDVFCVTCPIHGSHELRESSAEWGRRIKNRGAKLYRLIHGEPPVITRQDALIKEVLKNE